MIRVAIAEDHSRLRQAWVFILSREPGIKIVAECANGEEAIRAVKDHSPDIILMDINMHPINGIEATEKISKNHSATRVIGLSMHSDISYVHRMMKAGAAGYVTKNSPSKELIMAIHLVGQGQQYLCNEVRKSMQSF